VHAAIALVVTVQAHAAQRDPPATGLFQIAVDTVRPSTCT
jgi:hypothetical protein